MKPAPIRTISTACIFAFLAAFACALAAAGKATADSPVIQAFDGPDVTWQLTDPRPGVQLLAHGCVTDDAREGTGSERLVVSAPAGESVHLTTHIGRVPVLDELEARLWVKSNRPGVTLAARIVLPRSKDASTGEPRTALLQGKQYDGTGRWQQLQLSNVPKLLANEIRVMRATPGMQADAHEAYLDAIVLIVPGGPGGTAVWTDALEIDGVVMPASHETSTPTSPATLAVQPATAPQRMQQLTVNSSGSPAARPPAQPPIQRQGTTLMVAGKPFLTRGIQWNGEPLAFLAAHGFNTVWIDGPPTSEQTAEANRTDMWFVCTPPRPDELTATGLGTSLDRVLAWHLGTPAAPAELDYFRRWAELVRQRDPLSGRPIIAAPQNDWMSNSKLADVLLAGHPAAVSFSQAEFADWLQSIPLLARPGTPFWASIPTQPGQHTMQQAAALSSAASQTSIISDDQLELLVRTAATSGCRGFLLESDTPLDARDDVSRHRALAVEAANRQLQLLEPWLTVGKNCGQVVSSDGSITAVVMQTERARILVPVSRKNPSANNASSRNAAPKTVAIVVPGVPESNGAFLLSPAGLTTLAAKRVAGGMNVVLNADDEGFILLTEDSSVVTNMQQRAAQMGQRAVVLERDLALASSKTVADTGRRLKQLNIETNDSGQELGSANSEVTRCNSLMAAGNFRDAYQRAVAARRTLSAATVQQQISLDRSGLMNLPFGARYDTLIRQAEFQASLATLRGSENQLAGGGFEDLGLLQQFGWQHVADPLPGIRSSAELSADAPHSGRYCLRLSAAPQQADSAPQIVGRPMAWITAPPIRAEAGQFVEISGWIRIPKPLTGSVEGLEIIDSLGGSELAYRAKSSPEWQQFRLIRGTNETTDVTLSIALTCVGTAMIDDISVRSLGRPSVRRLPPVTITESQPPSAANFGPLLAPPGTR